MVELREPATIYRDSYLEALREYHAEGRNLRLDLRSLSEDFESFVHDLLSRANPAQVRPGYVPETIRWLIDGDQFIGRASIRHELNDHLLIVGGHVGYDIRPSKRRQGYGRTILRLALQQARALGLGRILVTCDSTNIGSKKIIEYNGGKLENEIVVAEDQISKLRYWIDLAPARSTIPEDRG